MKKLLRIEWIKNAGNPVFWVIIGLYAISVVAELFGAEAFINKVTSDVSRNSPIPIPNMSIYVFPSVWHNLTYLAGFLKPLLAFVVILFITNEFTYRTLRQHIINGLSRSEVFLTKLIFISALSFLSVVLVFLSGIILGLFHTKDIEFGQIIENQQFIWAYFLEMMGVCSFALMLSIVLKRSGVSIVVFSVYFFILEPVLRFNLDDPIASYLPMKAFGKMIDVPNTSLMKLFGVNFREFISISDVMVSLLYLIIFLIISYIIIRKRDS